MLRRMHAVNTTAEAYCEMIGSVEKHWLHELKNQNKSRTAALQVASEEATLSKFPLPLRNQLKLSNYIIQLHRIYLHKPKGNVCTSRVKQTNRSRQRSNRLQPSC